MTYEFEEEEGNRGNVADALDFWREFEAAFQAVRAERGLEPHVFSDAARRLVLLEFSVDSKARARAMKVYRNRIAREVARDPKNRGKQ